MNKKIIFISVFFLIFCLPAIWAVWEGNAGIALSSDFSQKGLYAKSDLFPKNTIVEIINLESDKKTRVVITGPAQIPGLVVLVSPEAAEQLYFRPNSLTRVRISVPPLVVEKPANDIDNEYFNDVTNDFESEMLAREHIDYVLEDIIIPESLLELDETPETEKIEEPDFYFEEPSLELVLAKEIEEDVLDALIKTDVEISSNEEDLKDSIDTIDETIIIIDPLVYLSEANIIAEDPIEVVGPIIPDTIDENEPYSEEPIETVAPIEDLEQDAIESQFIVSVDKSEAAPEEKIALETEKDTIGEMYFDTITETYLEPSDPVLPPVLEPQKTEEKIEPTEYFASKDRQQAPEIKDTRLEIYDIKSESEELPFITTFEKDSYYVQIASFKELLNIQQFYKTFKNNYPIAVQADQEQTDKGIRVFIGPVKKDEYGAVLFKFRELGYKDAFVKKTP